MPNVRVGGEIRLSKHGELESALVVFLFASARKEVLLL